MMNLGVDFRSHGYLFTQLLESISLFFCHILGSFQSFFFSFWVFFSLALLLLSFQNSDDTEVSFYYSSPYPWGSVRFCSSLRSPYCSDQIASIAFFFHVSMFFLSSAPSLLLWNPFFELFILVNVFFHLKFSFGSPLYVSYFCP